MKKLTFLLFTVLIVACSSDDSSDGNQLFIEKYDSVVWEQLRLENDDFYRIAFINSSNSITEYYLDNGVESCTTNPIDGTRNTESGILTTSIQEETENSLSILYCFCDEDSGDGIEVLSVLTVTSNGSSYTLTETFPDEEDLIYYNTNYDVCF